MLWITITTYNYLKLTRRILFAKKKDYLNIIILVINQRIQWFFRFWNVNGILQTFQTVHHVQHERFRYERPASITVLVFDRSWVFLNVPGSFWAFLVLKRSQTDEKDHETFTFTLQELKNQCIKAFRNTFLKVLSFT